MSILSGSYPWWLVIVGVIASALVVARILFFRWSQFQGNFRLEMALVGCLVLVTAVTYWYQLSSTTPGAYSDEITIGLAAQELVKQPGFVPFVSVNLGHPTPLLYLTGWLMQAFGSSLLTLRLVSLLFGVASVVVAYLCYRHFFIPSTAFFASLLMGLSYPMIILSRLAYEMTAALFFFLAAGLGVVWYLRTDSLRERLLLLSGTGIMLGWGLSTYLGFRLLAVAVVVLAVGGIAYRSRRDHPSQTIKSIATGVGILLLSIWLSAAPILTFAIRSPEAFWQRTRKVSVFHQQLPAGEMLKELGASTVNTLAMFIKGDPNFRHNPTTRPMFDYLTTGLMVIGLLSLVLGKKKSGKHARVLAGLSLALALWALLNDVLTIEIIPDFRYYGQGHPNTLRVFGVIPLVYFWVGWAFEWWYHLVTDKRYYLAAMATVTGLAMMLNLLWYYGQRPDTVAAAYIYQINQVMAVEAAALTQQLPAESEIFVSPSLVQSSHFQFLRQPEIEVRTQSDAPAVEDLAKHQSIWIVTTDDSERVKLWYEEQLSPLADFKMLLHYNLQGEIDLVSIVPRDR